MDISRRVDDTIVEDDENFTISQKFPCNQESRKNDSAEKALNVNKSAPQNDSEMITLI